MRIVLLGKVGQLGWELQRALQPLGPLLALDYPEIDLLSPESFVTPLLDFAPQIIINATAYTAVDRAESEADKATAINALAPGVLAELAKQTDALLIHYSTDYVFDGLKGSPYLETDFPHPLSVYGQSKLEGEKAIQQAGRKYLIFRTSWVYSLRRDSFVTKVLGWARQNTTLRVVEDQVSNPTWARMLAEATAQLLAAAKRQHEGLDWLAERSGLYHLAGSGYASRLEWAQAILELDPRPQEQQVRQLIPARSDEFPTPARRPLFSALDCQKFTQTFNLCLPDWRAALALAMAEL